MTKFPVLFMKNILTTFIVDLGDTNSPVNRESLQSVKKKKITNIGVTEFYLFQLKKGYIIPCSTCNSPY